VDGWVGPEVVVFTDHYDRLGALRAGLEEQGHPATVALWGDDSVFSEGLNSAMAVVIQVDSIETLRLDLVRALAGPGQAERRVVIIGEGTVADRVRLLNAGADLCLPPGLSDEELLARVIAVLRQAGPPGRRAVLHEGDLTVDLARRAAAYRGRRLMLSQAEYRSLRELALRVMETRSRFSTPGGDDRLTMALRRLSDFAERLEQSTQARMMDRAQLDKQRPQARRAKA